MSSAFVNRVQSPEERKTKYWMMRQVGWPPRMCRVRRDWTWSHIEKHMVREINSWEVVK